MADIDSIISRKEIRFEEALQYFGGKVPIKSAEFYKLADEYKALAFTVANYSKAHILKKFYDRLLAILEEGGTLAEFREDMSEFLEAEGYKGLTPFQAENIFRTNIQTAYNVGHYRRMTQPEVMRMRPYWQYEAVEDDHTRKSHLAMHGKVFPADSPVWDTWFPPNGFKCRCTVRSLSQRQVEQLGLTVEEKVPNMERLKDGRFVNMLPDPHFGTNPAKVTFTPDTEGFPESLAKAFAAAQKAQSGT